MGAFIARQPNGLLCRFSSIMDCVTHYNMTENDYIEMCAERARMEARKNLKHKYFIRPYKDVIDGFMPNNMTETEFFELRKKMGENL